MFRVEGLGCRGLGFLGSVHKSARNSYDYKLFSENRRVLYARYVIGALVNFT